MVGIDIDSIMVGMDGGDVPIGTVFTRFRPSKGLVLIVFSPVDRYNNNNNIGVLLSFL